MLDDDFNEDLDRKPLLQRLAVPLVGFVLFAGAGASAFFVLKGSSGPAARPHNEPHITQVQLPPPPPPPPPPKTPPPEPKKEQEVARQREPTPSKPVSMPAPKAPAPPNQVQTSIQGNGPSGLAAGNGGGGDCIGSTGCGHGDGAGGGGDNDAYYATLVKNQIQDALRRDEKLRFAHYRMTVSLSLDSSGRVANASISSFSGDDDVQAEVARALRSIATGNAPPPDILDKRFQVRITERPAQGL
jgi:TonB family protein